jgi:hypothetical protein
MPAGFSEILAFLTFTGFNSRGRRVETVEDAGCGDVLRPKFLRADRSIRDSKAMTRRVIDENDVMVATDRIG